MSQIIFDHVTKKFRNMFALNDISFEIEKGEFVFITGKSGAGKSTLLNLILKMEEVSEGRIIVGEKMLNDLKGSEIAEHRRRLGFMSYDVGLLKDRTVYDNISFAMIATEKADKKMDRTIKSLLKMVGLLGKMHAFPDQLSGGEQARILLARALCVRPEILIADEPTANLDPDSAWDMMQLLNEVNYQGTTVLVASHARELVTIMKKRCMTLVAGNLVADEKHSIYNSKAMDVFEERRVRNALNEGKNRL